MQRPLKQTEGQLIDSNIDLRRFHNEKPRKTLLYLSWYYTRFEPAIQALISIDNGLPRPLWDDCSANPRTQWSNSREDFLPLPGGR
jgi:hypothetical protein